MSTGSFRDLMRLCYESLGKYRHLVFLAVACSMAMAVERAWLPYAIKDLVDVIGSLTDKSDLAPVYASVSLVVGVLVFSELLYRIGSYTMAFLYPRMQMSMRHSLYRHSLLCPMQFFMRTPIGSIGNRVYDLPLSSQSAMRTVLEIFAPIITSLLVTVVLAFTVSKPIGILYALWISIHMTIAVFANIKGAQRASSHAESLNQLQGYVIDSLSNINHIKIFDNYDVESKHFLKYQAREKKSNQNMLFFMENVKLGLFFLTSGEFLLVLYLAIAQWQYDMISTGDLVFILQTNVGTMLLMWWFTIEGSFLVQVLGRCMRSVSLLQVPKVDNTLGDSISITEGEISFKDIDFSYESNRALFSNLNIAIRGGETVAIIGLSGSGKTTLLNLLLKTYSPQQGSITIDGQDIAHASLQSLYSQVTVVPQGVNLFNRSILDNILYGRPEADMNEVKEAALKAHCHEFIMMLPNGYDTIIGSDTNLSSGQRQRILIARAMLKISPIVILDEATSALDNVTEMHVREAISNLIVGKTALIIAHRLSTISIADRVLIMDGGKVVDFDTPANLEKNSPTYLKLRDSCLL